MGLTPGEFSHMHANLILVLIAVRALEHKSYIAMFRWMQYGEQFSHSIPLCQNPSCYLLKRQTSDSILHLRKSKMK